MNKNKRISSVFSALLAALTLVCVPVNAIAASEPPTAIAAETEIKRLSLSGLVIGRGEEAYLENTIDGAPVIEYLSSDKSVVSVDSGGKITALKRGSAFVTAICENGASTDCEIRVMSAPNSIFLNKTEITLGVGESFDLNAKFNKNEFSRGTVFSSNNSEAVEVNAENGIIKAKKTGSATITAQTFNGKTVTCQVTAAPAPDSVTLGVTEATIGVGDTLNLDAVIPEGSACCELKYTSTNRKAASVRGTNGVVTGVGVGTATIIVSTHNGKKAACKINVKAAPETISLNREKLTLGVGETFDLDVVFPDNSYTNCLKFISGRPDLVSVDENGVITAKNSGKTQIIVKNGPRGYRVVCYVTVKKAPRSILLNKSSVTMGNGESYQLVPEFSDGEGANEITFSSDNPNIVSVDESGTITCNSVGTSTVTVTAYNGVKESCNVTVKEAPGSISLNKTELNLLVGETFDLDSSLPGGTASRRIPYTSDNPLVATVAEAGGLVTAVSAGTANVTATTFNGKTAACKVNVYNAPTAIYFNEKNVTITAGGTKKPGYSFPKLEYTDKLSFSSSNSYVADVSADGTISAKNAGTATITVTTYNGKTSACVVTVEKTADSARLSNTRMIMGKGEKYTLVQSFNGRFDGNYTVSWSSSNPSVVSVLKAGGESKAEITAKSNGYAKITATVSNGMTASCYVTVNTMASSIHFGTKNTIMVRGEELNLKAYVDTTVGCYNKRYTTDNDSVVSVSGYRATAKAAGSARLTVTMDNGASATTNVTVKSPDAFTTAYTSAATTLMQDCAWSSSELTEVPKGSLIYKYGTSDDGRWIKVKYRDRYGWIYNLALGASKNYSSINTTTLPVVIDDIIFNTGTSMRSIYNYVYALAYRNTGDDAVENLCVYALNYGRGSCYHHAAMLYYMLNRCGYETIIVKGIDDYTGGSDHAWCMTKTANGWRHIDAQRIIGLSGSLNNSDQYLVTDLRISRYFTWNRYRYPSTD